MADRKFTLVELHLDEGSIQVGSSGLGVENGVTDPSAETEADGESGNGGTGPGRSVGKFLVVLVGVALLALGFKKLLGGGEDLDELEDLADLDEGET
ncbi:MAG: hypothetical protein ABEH58_04465 [Haloplanus sp.]